MQSMQIDIRLHDRVLDVGSWALHIQISFHLRRR